MGKNLRINNDSRYAIAMKGNIWYIKNELVCGFYEINITWLIAQKSVF